jgi:hypothetical protein
METALTTMTAPIKTRPPKIVGGFFGLGNNSVTFDPETVSS